MFRKVNSCPKCGGRINGSGLIRLEKKFGFDKTFPCPECGQLLKLSKWPYIFLSIGVLLEVIPKPFLAV